MKLNRKKNSIEKKYGKVSDVSYFSLTETWKLDILSEKYGDNKLFACPHIKKKNLIVEKLNGLDLNYFYVKI